MCLTRCVAAPRVCVFCVGGAVCRTGNYPDPARIKHHPTSFWIKLSALLNVGAGAAYIWWRAARSMPDNPVRCGRLACYCRCLPSFFGSTNSRLGRGKICHTVFFGG